MTSEIIDNTLSETAAEYEAVAEATERCLRAEKQFGSGEIGLIDLYKIYQEIYQNSIPADANVDYGPWSHIFWRRRRLLRLVNEKHLRKSHGSRGGHRRNRYWDACDWMDGARDIQARLNLETDASTRSRLNEEFLFRKRIVLDVAQREKRQCPEAYAPQPKPISEIIASIAKQWDENVKEENEKIA